MNSVLAILRQGRFDSLFRFNGPSWLGRGIDPLGDDFLGRFVFTLHNLAVLFPSEIHRLDPVG